MECCCTCGGVGTGVIDVDEGCIRCRREGVAGTAILMASRRRLLQGVEMLLMMVVSCGVKWVKVGAGAIQGQTYSFSACSFFIRALASSSFRFQSSCSCGSQVHIKRR